VAGTTATKTTNTISFDAASMKIIRNVAGSFITDGFTTGMRIEISGSTTANNGAYTLDTVQAATMVVYETLFDEASGVNKTIIGHTMSTIGQITAFNGPAISAAIIDVTNLQSTAKEKLVAVRDEGQLSITINLDPTVDADQHMSLKDDLRNRTRRMFDIRFTDVGTSLPSACYFAGYVNGFNPSGGLDKQLTAEITIALTSAIMWTSAV
jgi:hypothetical protein